MKVQLKLEEADRDTMFDCFVAVKTIIEDHGPVPVNLLEEHDALLTVLRAPPKANHTMDDVKRVVRVMCGTSCALQKAFDMNLPHARNADMDSREVWRVVQKIVGQGKAQVVGFEELLDKATYEEVYEGQTIH